MINSDFNVGSAINRENLHQLMVSNEMYSSFEPCIYPGVNIKYFYNSCHQGGACKCERVCNGKGLGNGDGNCRRITIAVFKSGNIIITAAMNREQLEVCYKFIDGFIKKHGDNVMIKENQKHNE